MNQSSMLKRAHTTRRKGPGAQGQAPLLKALFVFLLVERAMIIVIMVKN